MTIRGIEGGKRDAAGAGSFFVSRMLTVATSLRAQDCSVLEYLVQVCQASRQGLPTPSFLPIQDSTP